MIGYDDEMFCGDSSFYSSSSLIRLHPSPFIEQDKRLAASYGQMMTTFYRACMDQVQEAREGGGKPTTALLSSWKAVRAFDAVHGVR